MPVSVNNKLAVQLKDFGIVICCLKGSHNHIQSGLSSHSCHNASVLFFVLFNAHAVCICIICLTWNLKKNTSNPLMLCSADTTFTCCTTESNTYKWKYVFSWVVAELIPKPGNIQHFLKLDFVWYSYSFVTYSRVKKSKTIREQYFYSAFDLNVILFFPLQWYNQLNNFREKLNICLY